MQMLEPDAVTVSWFHKQSGYCSVKTIGLLRDIQLIAR